MGPISDYMARNQQALKDARALADDNSSPVEENRPMTAPPITIRPGGALDPLGNVRSDVADAYQRGAQSSPATGVGMAVREAVVSPVSRILGSIADAGKGALSVAATAGAPVYEAGRAAVTGQLPPPPTISDSMLSKLPPVTSADAAPALTDAPAVQGTAMPQGQQSPLSPRRVMITGFQEQQPYYSSYQPLIQQDPTQQILASQNDGTWSGMINARTLAHRTDADRAASVAAATAASHVISSLASAQTARSGETRAQGEAGEARARTGLLQQQALNAQFEQQKRQQAEDLTREMVDPKTTPERRKAIEQILVSLHGRNPSNPQVHATPIFDQTGQKVGERLHERQADGSWKDVTPKAGLRDNPQAMAIVNDPNMKDDEKRSKLKAMGYQ